MSDIQTIPADLSPRDNSIDVSQPADNASASWWLLIAIGIVALVVLARYFR